MKIHIFLILLSFSASLWAKGKVAVKLPKTWVSYKPEAFKTQNMVMYSLKDAKSGKVLHQSTAMTKLFPELSQETRHQCKILERQMNKKITVRKEGNTQFCYIPGESLMIVSENAKSERSLHVFSFDNMKKTEIDEFIKHVRYE